ncbi:hypothetical protein RCL1_007361 [Eukaryota sp. TZLM3-RCL]
MVFWFLLPAVAGSSFVASVYYFQNKLLFQPSLSQLPCEETNPSLDSIAFEDVYIPSTDNVRLHSWFIPATNATPSNPAPVLLYFHGNAGNIASRTSNLCTLFRAFNNEISILIIDYRGYGLSTGTPSEEGLYQDGLASYDWLLSQPLVDSSKIFVFGRSLGGAVATYVSRHRDVRGLILENTFASIKDLIPFFFPQWVSKSLPDFMIRSKFPSIDHINHVTNPILFISGEVDEVIPPCHSVMLHDAALRCCRKQLISIPKGTHNETWIIGGSEYFYNFVRFLYTCLNSN